MHKNRYGFSLVELSIVLVILGLLVGGVLAGRSLIHAAEIRSVASDANMLTTSMYSFRDKYLALPGDIPNASQFFNCTDCNGNGDGAINAFSDTPIATNRYEASVLMLHLSLAGLINGTYTGDYVDVSSRRVNSMDNAYRGKIDRTTFSVSRPDLWGVTSGLRGKTAICLGIENRNYSCNGPQNAAAPYRLYGEDGWNIDTKIDDGSARTGRVLADSCNSLTTSNGFDDVTIYRSSNTLLEYNIADTTKSCGLMFLQ